jgi:hypothetical protein
MKPLHIGKESQQNIKNIQTKQFNFIKLTQKQAKHMPAKQHNHHSQSNQNKNSKQT